MMCIVARGAGARSAGAASTTPQPAMYNPNGPRGYGAPPNGMYNAPPGRYSGAVDAAMLRIGMPLPPRVRLEESLTQTTPLVHTKKTAKIFERVLSEGRDGLGDTPADKRF